MQTLEQSKTTVTIKGVLNQLNWADNTCQIVADGETVDCTFADSLKPLLKHLLGDVVEADGHMAHANSANPTPTRREFELEGVRRGFTPPNPVLLAQVQRDLEQLAEEGPNYDVGDAVEIVRRMRNPDWGGQ